MKTKNVIQFRSGPLKGQFVSNWSANGWLFTTTDHAVRAHRFDSLTLCNLMRILWDVPNDTIVVAVSNPQMELGLSAPLERVNCC